ncbi:hypothetical protein RB596_005506 [Gaeumannomyces avenae]
MIWKHAATTSSDRPGVHFLTATSTNRRQQDVLVRGLRQLLDCDNVSDGGALPVRRYSGADPGRRIRKYPWTRKNPWICKNPSSYMMVSALRATCWESRVTVAKFCGRLSALTARTGCQCAVDFGYLPAPRRSNTAPSKCPCPPLCDYGWSCRPVASDDLELGDCGCPRQCDLDRPAAPPSVNKAKTCLFDTNGKGETQHFRVSPSDLVCVTAEDLVKVFPDTRVGGGPRVGGGRSGNGCPFHGSVNVAVEFPVPGDVMWLFVRAHLPLQKLWLVEYRLKRSPFGQGAENNRIVAPDRAVFYGNGVRFVEVRADDPGWELTGQQLAPEQNPFQNPFRFAKLAHDSTCWH